MTSQSYPNIEKLTRMVDRGLGVIFSLIKFGFFLFVVLTLFLLIVL